ncbi:MAG: DsrE family protein [Desulfitobacteriaceae bacterium]|nr:DsrE family protein [Desulfitobacteriaceae bacterium]MDI6913760.1 DsrE family protein [Desulfitobacteriaceae bacterium]
MAKSVCILVRHAPYGMTHAAEAVRHINGAVANGFATTAIFVDDGVYVLKNQQDVAATGFTNLGNALADASAKMEPKASILVHRFSAGMRGLGEEDILPGVQWVDDAELAELLTDTTNLMLF